MMRYSTGRREKGVVMLVSLLLLIILSVIGMQGMSNGIFNLRMAGNIQNLYDSFQMADAGIAATMADGGHFDGTDQADIFAGGDPGSTKDFIVAEVDVERLLPDVELDCPRAPGASSILDCPRAPGASSIGFIGCERYLVDSEHEDAATGARTRVYQGVVREIISR